MPLLLHVLLFVGLTAAGAAACGAAPAPDSFALTGGTRSASKSAADPHLRIDPDGAAAWVDHPLAPEAWRAGENDTWIAARPDGMGFLKSGEELALAGQGVSYANRPEVDNLADLVQLEPGTFADVGELLHLKLAPGERPRETLVFSVRKYREAGARPALGAWTGDGFTLWPGETISFPVELAPGRALGFYWCAEGLLGRTATHAWLRVTLDGAVLTTLESEVDSLGEGRWCRVALPEQGVRAARLAFELGGEPSLAAVLAPRVVPAASAPRTTPDLVLFLADTFRADNLAYLGGAPELAPELNLLAAESVRFADARSPSTWTLPSQASMLTGLYPEQHGATSLGHGLAPAIGTLPELLARHGYRTGAVTDSAFVSRNYGLDQGCEWFQEFRTWDLRATLRAAREFLAADDGRPTFLFVQTYRTHMPYRTGADEDRRALQELVDGLRRGNKRRGGDGSISDREAGRRMLGVYHEGVRALDEQFGTFWRELAGQARAPIFLAFTSDHGEAFLEHGEVGHGGAPWEEKIRIPLFLHGPGLTPATVAGKASLVDLPRTFCALAGIEPPAELEGRNLLAPNAAADSPAYSFVRIGDESMVAVIAGTRKLYARADPARLAAGEVRLATDLAQDPSETDYTDKGAWPAELARAQASAIERLTRAMAAPQRVELSPEDQSFLDGIGYGGGEK